MTHNICFMTGISAGANEALRRVKSPLFISFEQDLLLAKNWWNKVSSYLEHYKVAVASGVQLPDKPVGLRKLYQYSAKKGRGEAKFALHKIKEEQPYSYGKTLDNTIYKTKVIGDLGGFPQVNRSSDVDVMLAYEIADAGFRWVVDYDVQSTHLRHGLKSELKHEEWHGFTLYEINRKIREETGEKPWVTKWGTIFRFVFSLATGLFIALTMNQPSIAYIYL